MYHEASTVDPRIASETEFPTARRREANGVAVLSFMKEVGNNHDIVRWSALVPAMQRDNLASVVWTIDVGGLPTEATSEILAVEPQSYEVAVQPNDARKLLLFVSIHRHIIAKPSAFEEFLTLKDHRDARRDKD